eukprot:NODE_348_length_1606_cov_171.966870_g316_i0.p1 GENE.NODE_348_length_1606_cov_171.966870_g316_i0~~NODE_348_length_1606_cov_171.966870_g316_i0.p1  ORF type:complete len:352 (+),score=34.22 NODE_348_length_1606_cov_171.966870_g316_i0:82-1137(+)
MQRPIRATASGVRAPAVNYSYNLSSVGTPMVQQADYRALSPGWDGNQQNFMQWGKPQYATGANNTAVALLAAQQQPAARQGFAISPLVQQPQLNTQGYGLQSTGAAANPLYMAGVPSTPRLSPSAGQPAHSPSGQMLSREDIQDMADPLFGPSARSRSRSAARQQAHSGPLYDQISLFEGDIPAGYPRSRSAGRPPLFDQPPMADNARGRRSSLGRVPVFDQPQIPMAAPTNNVTGRRSSLGRVPMFDQPPTQMAAPTNNAGGRRSSLGRVQQQMAAMQPAVRTARKVGKGVSRTNDVANFLGYGIESPLPLDAFSAAEQLGQVAQGMGALGDAAGAVGGGFGFDAQAESC